MDNIIGVHGAIGTTGVDSEGHGGPSTMYARHYLSFVIIGHWSVFTVYLGGGQGDVVVRGPDFWFYWMLPSPAVGRVRNKPARRGDVVTLMSSVK
jgi:hypothetical protein